MGERCVTGLCWCRVEGYQGRELSVDTAAFTTDHHEYKRLWTSGASGATLVGGALDTRSMAFIVVILVVGFSRHATIHA